jgi:ATP-dependent RNA helicase DDX21
MFVCFREAAEKLLAASDTPVDALARALAHITGHKQLKARSLLTAHDDSTTLMFASQEPIQYLGAVWGYLK